MAKRPVPPTERIRAPLTDLTALPAGVAAMRDKILDAVAAADIEALRPAIERNETLPIFGRGSQPGGFTGIIDFLRHKSFDGEGREILDLLRGCFAQPYGTISRGPVDVYVWPAAALVGTADLAGDARLALYACVRFANLRVPPDGIAFPPIERVGIGGDGTWHYFWSG